MRCKDGIAILRECKDSATKMLSNAAWEGDGGNLRKSKDANII